MKGTAVTNNTTTTPHGIFIDNADTSDTIKKSQTEVRNDAFWIFHQTDEISVRSLRMDKWLQDRKLWLLGSTLPLLPRR